MRFSRRRHPPGWDTLNRDKVGFTPAHAGFSACPSCDTPRDPMAVFCRECAHSVLSLIRGEVEPGAAWEPRWHDLSPYRDELESLAERLHVAKSGLVTQNLLVANPDLLGFMGQKAYEIETGLRFSRKIGRHTSDGGTDFEDGVDVKTTYFQPNPHLLEYKRTRHIAPRYALAVIRGGTEGAIYGWATRRMLEEAPLWTSKNGKACYRLNWRSLMRDNPSKRHT